MFIANYNNCGEDDWLIFVAPDKCDRVKEFLHAFNCENGYKYADKIYPENIYLITTAYDYRTKTGWNYNIKLMKD